MMSALSELRFARRQLQPPTGSESVGFTFKDFNALYGSYNTDKELAYASGTSKGVEYLVNYSRYSSDGYRDNSENEKEAATVKLKTNISKGSPCCPPVLPFAKDQFGASYYIRQVHTFSSVPTNVLL
jgi:hypothetical protein